MMFISQKLLEKLKFEKLEETDGDISFLKYRKELVEVTLLWQFNRFDFTEANNPNVNVTYNGGKTRVKTEVELTILLNLMYYPQKTEKQ